MNIGINSALRPAEQESPMIQLVNFTEYRKSHAVRCIPKRTTMIAHSREEYEIARSEFYKRNQNIEKEFKCLHAILR